MNEGARAQERTASTAGLRGATLYVDCYAGVAGDMMLGALLDLGVPEPVVRDALAKLPMGGWELRVSRVRRGVMMGTRVEVLTGPGGLAHEHGHAHGSGHGHDHEHGHGPAGHSHEHGHAYDPHHGHAHAHDHGDHPHVHYADIRQMIQRTGLAPGVVQRALAVFDRIAVVEAEMHGLAVERVTFHEVGAVDSIIDIVGAAAALDWLAPRRVLSRRVALGGGMVRTAHGLLPVPAPATLALLKGAEVEAGGATVELTTPTGAGLLAANVVAYGPLPPMRVVATGFGAGTRELPDRPNLLRLVAGAEDAAAIGECVVLEANLDDMNPELCAPLLESLLATGARDVWYTPVTMKKGRPALIIGVLCDPDKEDALATLLLRESTTLGVRGHRVWRHVLAREHREVATPYGAVQVKLGLRGGEVWNLAPEYESCRARAQEHGVPLKLVYAAALAAALTVKQPPGS